MKLDEIASRVTAYLERFEADPKLNVASQQFGTRPYFLARAFANGTKLGIVYINYQGHSNLTKVQALRYLAWLDAGNIGTHYRMEREGK